MKLTKLFLGVLISSVFALSSCTNNDDSNETTESITDQEAVALIESSLQKSTTGLNDTTEKFSEELTTNITINLNCDEQYDNTFVTNYEGENLQANYTVDWSYIMTCNQVSIPQSVEFSFATDGNYTTQHINSNDTSAGFLEINGLQPTETQLTINGDFVRQGMQVLTVINERAVTSKLEVTLLNTIVEKETNTIVSGSGTIVLTGTSQNRDFSFDGSITFNGNGLATLTINGNSYQINLG
jgi:hypothetical protein